MKYHGSYTAVKTARLRLCVVDGGRSEVLTTAVGHGERYQVLLDASARHEVTRVSTVHVSTQSTNLSHTRCTHNQ